MNTPQNPEGRNFADLIGEMTEEEKRSAFRELAKSLLDPSADGVSTICDNEGNVLGYFEPALHRMRSKAEHFSTPVENLEEFIEGSEPFDELVNRTMHSGQTNN